MQINSLPEELLLLISGKLDIASMLSLGCVNQLFAKLLRDRYLWQRSIQRHSIFCSSPNTIDIKKTLREQYCSITAQVNQIVPSTHPLHQTLLKDILFYDDTDSLLTFFANRQSRFAKQILRIALKFSRIKLMHTLFNHYDKMSSFEWLLLAIRYQQLPAVQYLVEQQNAPLITFDRAAILPMRAKKWHEEYMRFDYLGRRYAGEFTHFNKLLLRELLMCDDMHIVRYIKDHLEQALAQLGKDHPYQALFKKMRRHSVGCK